MTNGPTIVHVTHETTQKIGGIGAVLKGLFTGKSYLDFARRSIVAGPLFDRNGSVSTRLGEGGNVLYSFLDGLANTRYAPAFQEIERIYNAGIIYGTKTFVDEQSGIESSPEIILVDVTQMRPEPVSEFKKQLYERFGVQSDRYEHIWEYEQYIRMAPVILSILKAIEAGNGQTIIAGHEWMGMPTILAGLCDNHYDFRTVFYAHEVATVRRIVEEEPGRDIRFYKELKHGQAQGKYLADVFGDQSDYFKHQLIEASRYCHAILAVGDYAASELRFLRKDFEDADINVVYNGIGAYKTDVPEKAASKEKLRQYCYNLLGYKPDFVFSHVTRLVRSKGLWRDIGVLENLEKKFRDTGRTAVLFVLSTEVGQRDKKSILAMESSYGWPVAHKQDWPDMSGGETKFYTLIQRFNARSRNIKIVFINQFGFESKYCGDNMPEGTTLVDLRRGCDMEFGMSTYEPFGISHIEPLTYGGICVLSSVCGCAGFIRGIAGEKPPANIIVADYIDSQKTDSLNEAMLEKIEQDINAKLAEEIYVRLQNADPEQIIRSGYGLAQKMSWDEVVSNYILPSLQNVLQKADAKVVHRLKQAG